jgi:hypothetical protein
MCSHILFPVVVTGLEQVAITLLYNVDDGNRLATSCYKINTGCAKQVATSLLSSTCEQLVTCISHLLEQLISHLLEQLVSNLLATLTLLQDDNNLFQTYQQLGTTEQAVRTDLVDKLVDVYHRSFFKQCTVLPRVNQSLTLGKILGCELTSSSPCM